MLCLMLALSLCAGLLTVLGAPVSAASLEERQQAVVAVAMAYYDKGRSVQYDGATIVDGVPRAPSGKTRSTNCEAPEYATANETLYSVCSDFAHQVYYEAFGYHILGSAGACWTDGILKIPKDDPMVIYTYEKSSGKDVKEALTEMFALAQPGDVFTTFSTAGHTMIYVGDVFGDGKTYLAHCFGGAFNTDTGADTREYAPSDKTDPRYRAVSYKDANGGAIRLTPDALQHAIKSYGKGNQERMNLIRPLNSMKESDYSISPATKYRMSHPRLSIDRLVEGKTRFLSAVKGETLKLDITLKNSSSAAYTVPVTEKVPAGVKLVKDPEGATVSGDTITWNVELPAGGQKELVCEYEVTADRGTQIVFTGGSVGDIPSNTIPITVGGAKLNATQLDRLAKIGTGAYDAVLSGAKDSGFAAAVYEKVLGLKVAFPDVKTVVEKLTDDKQVKTSSGTVSVRVFKEKSAVAAEDQNLYSLLVPMFHGGRNVWNAWGHERINDLKDQHVEPGDVIVRSRDVRTFKMTDTLVYLGDGKYAKYGASNKPVKLVDEPELVKSLMFAAFYCFRPTLAYDDIQSIYAEPSAAAAALKFTDVKESDWYYTYVKDLVEDGTVNGMTATTFAPNGTLTYGQALKLITLGVGEKEPAKSGSHWASGYLTLAKEKGWLSEDVNLDGTITRLQLCRIAAKAKNLTAQPESNPFKDTSDKDVLALNKAGVIAGMTATEFKPEGLLTRAQIAKIIWTLRKV